MGLTTEIFSRVVRKALLSLVIAIELTVGLTYEFVALALS